MFLGIRKKYWYMLTVTLALSGLMFFLYLSPVFAVRELRLQGPYAAGLDKNMDKTIATGTNMFRLDKEKLARQILRRDHIENVRISISPPEAIRGEINRFEPAALLVADQIYGLDRFCRLIPWDSTWENIDLPVLTGLEAGKMFQPPADYRAAEIVEGIVSIKDELPDLYEQIAEINFSDDVYVGIYLTTGTDRYLATSRDFQTQLLKLDMVSRSVSRSDDGCYNLTFDGVVIKQK